MPERSDVLFDRGLEVFGAVVTQVGLDDWDRPSPCEGWTSLDVLGHLCTSVAFGASVLRAEEPTWPDVARPADVIEGDPIAFWTVRAATARDALNDADLEVEMETPMGTSTVAQRLTFPAIDLYVDAWDIGHAIGIDVEVPADVIELAHLAIDPIPVDKARGPGGAFGPEVEAPPNATATETFIAWTGRQPR